MDDTIQTTAPFPRIVLKRTSVNKKLGWEIASSSHKDKEELEKIVDMIEEINLRMETKFTKANIKEGVEKKK